MVRTKGAGSGSGGRGRDDARVRGHASARKRRVVERDGGPTAAPVIEPEEVHQEAEVHHEQVVQEHVPQVAVPQVEKPQVDVPQAEEEDELVLQAEPPFPGGRRTYHFTTVTQSTSRRGRGIPS